MNIDHVEIQQLMRQMVDLGIADNLKLWVHSGLVKTRASGSDLYVPKAYDISGEENDGVQTTEDNQPTLDTLGIKHNRNVDCLDCGNDNSVKMVDSISVGVWVYATTLLSHRDIIGRWGFATNRRVWLIRSNGSQLQVWVSATGTEGSKLYISTIASSVWEHWLFTFTTNTLLVYKNGSVINPIKYLDSTCNSLYNTDFNLILGNAQNEISIRGVINDARVFNSVLTSTQISAIYNATKTKYGHS